MANIDFFLTEMITVPIGFRLFAIGGLFRKQSEKIFGLVGPGLYTENYQIPHFT